MEKIYRVQMNKSGMPNFSTAVEVADRPTWISCSERLPRAKYGESENVLASCESGHIHLLYFDGGNWCYPTGEAYEHNFDPVIAWMPLPEPWKGADDE